MKIYCNRAVCNLSFLTFAGVGYAAAISAAWLNTYYIVILSWALFYLVNSFQAVLPWSHCDNWYNTDSCRSEYDRPICSNATNASSEVSYTNGVLPSTAMTVMASINETQCDDGAINYTSPVREFWEYVPLPFIENHQGNSSKTVSN